MKSDVNTDPFGPLTGQASGGSATSYGLTGTFVTIGDEFGFDLEQRTLQGTFLLNSKTGAYRFEPDTRFIEAIEFDHLSLSFEITATNGITSYTKQVTIDLSGVQDGPSVTFSGQWEIPTLTQAGVHFETGADVLVNGAAFLNSGTAASGAAAALFGDADVTVALTDEEVGQIATSGDVYFDKLVTALEASGVDTISISADQAGQLASSAGSLTFDVGTDVLVNGTSFLNHGSTTSITAAASLFGDADVTVALTPGDIASLVSGTDGDFDSVITALEHAGVDTISIDAGQALQLAGADFDFDVGTDVLVNGTSFLNHGSTNSITAAAALFGDADVTVSLTQGDVASLVSGTDGDFDNVITALESAGVDTISIDAGQAIQLAGAALTSMSARTRWFKARRS